MKLPLMASLTALLLGGCATQTAAVQQQPPSEAFATDEMSWDAQESPRTQEMFRTHGMNFYGDVGADAQASAAATDGTGIPKSSKPEDFQCVDVDTLGTGGSGSIDTRKVDPLAPEPAPSQSEGARLDITPDGWHRNKGIGTSPVAPSTGTPPEEGSGGAGH
ncbi:hypothetical protein KH5H1_52810 [Corallococcus caeni]|uniref:Lipoprotein n=1 Tax=Corallococcus caeni TaxID=3082388 RepID=A0ABQ6QIZ1_9BACT|nr:hypothetical protein KH5H1_52810 [Corallococcus sp. KH5-1]GMU03963.1 hypothetical protein ASNO1_02150 [Corallococcus sp. NO1]